jgi:hypothetical protein
MHSEWGTITPKREKLALRGQKERFFICMKHKYTYNIHRHYVKFVKILGICLKTLYFRVAVMKRGEKHCLLLTLTSCTTVIT